MSKEKPNQKIFIIGLPRTGTTSVCNTMLDLGYRTAHTAYTQSCFDQAQAIADTPIFCDFMQLDQHYPNSKFIYLTRDLSLWLPSIKQLLQRMFVNVTRDDGGFNPIIKRCYQQTFAPFTLDKIIQDEFLTHCYQKHEKTVKRYFTERTADLLTIDISQAASYQQLLTFINKPQAPNIGFKQMNIGGKVTAWKDLKHTLKIESTKNGRISKLDYL